MAGRKLWHALFVMGVAIFYRHVPVLHCLKSPTLQIFEKLSAVLGPNLA